MALVTKNKSTGTRPTRARGSTDYAAIAAKHITRPAEQSERLPTLLVYSRNKKGKTRFGMSAGKDKVLIADPERGTDRFRKRNPHVWHITEWADLDLLYKFMKNADHDYEWVDLDGMTRISNMALRYVMKQAEEADINRQPGLVQQRDYGKAGELMKGMMYNFHNLPCGVIYSAQERVEDSSYTELDEDVEDAEVRYVPDLPKGVRATMNSLVDVIGRLYIAPIESEEEDTPTKYERRLWLAPSVAYDTGYRSDFVLPEYLSAPTVPKLVNLMNTGKATTNG